MNGVSARPTPPPRVGRMSPTSQAPPLPSDINRLPKFKDRDHSPDALRNGVASPERIRAISNKPAQRKSTNAMPPLASLRSKSAARGGGPRFGSPAKARIQQTLRDVGGGSSNTPSVASRSRSVDPVQRMAATRQELSHQTPTMPTRPPSRIRGAAGPPPERRSVASAMKSMASGRSDSRTKSRNPGTSAEQPVIRREATVKSRRSIGPLSFSRKSTSAKPPAPTSQTPTAKRANRPSSISRLSHSPLTMLGRKEPSRSSLKTTDRQASHASDHSGHSVETSPSTHSRLYERTKAQRKSLSGALHSVRLPRTNSKKQVDSVPTSRSTNLSARLQRLQGTPTRPQQSTPTAPRRMQPSPVPLPASSAPSRVKAPAKKSRASLPKRAAALASKAAARASGRHMERKNSGRSREDEAESIPNSDSVDENVNYANAEDMLDEDSDEGQAMGARAPSDSSEVLSSEASSPVFSRHHHGRQGESSRSIKSILSLDYGSNRSLGLQSGPSDISEEDPQEHSVLPSYYHQPQAQHPGHHDHTRHPPNGHAARSPTIPLELPVFVDPSMGLNHDEPDTARQGNDYEYFLNYIQPQHNRKTKYFDHSVENITELYELGEDIGSGGYSTVRRAIERATGYARAVKLVDIETYNKHRTRMEAEAAVLGSVSHPAIVKFYGIVRTPTHFCFVMELLMGGELFERIIDRKYGYPEPDACRLVMTILEAVEHLHANGVVHRDIKPENFLFDANGGELECGVLKLIDFGFATFQNPRCDMIGSSCGTPDYIAPELLLEKPHNQAVDIWSVGVVLYILLCGFPPFYAEDDDKLFDLIAEGAYDFPSPQWDHISHDARDLVTRLLQVDANYRWTATQALQHSWIVRNSLIFSQKLLDKRVSKATKKQ